MSWRFRQSFKILPGLKLNLSKSGLSASIGSAPCTLNLGPRGPYGTASIPGTGISFRQHLSGQSHPQFPADSSDLLGSREPDEFPSLPPQSPPALESILPPMREIRSGSTELLTSESLKELKRLIQTAYEEHEEISSQLITAKREKDRTTARFKSWDDGILFKRIFKSSFSARKAEAEIAAARVYELEEQLRLTSIATQIQLSKEQAELYFRLRDDFTALAECAAIWDVKAEKATDKFRERTIANRSVSRERIRFSLGSCELIRWEQSIPHLQNANGGDLFLYPGFILYRATRTAFSVVDFHDVKAAVATVKFHEEDGVPSDSTIVGQTWAKTNKDGSRDKRFAGNYQIPIALYGELTLKSETGLWEEFHFSNPERLARFEKSWKAFVASFDHRFSLVVAQEEAPPPELEPKPQSKPPLVGVDIHFECRECCQPIEVNAEAAGQEFRCPGCGTQLVVPEVTT